MLTTRCFVEQARVGQVGEASTLELVCATQELIWVMKLRYAAAGGEAMKGKEMFPGEYEWIGSSVSAK